MSHLTRDEIVRWQRDGADADRDRIVGHLAVCDECVALYRRVIDERAPDKVPVVPADLLAAGRAAYHRVDAAAPDRGAHL